MYELRKNKSGNGTTGKRRWKKNRAYKCSSTSFAFLSAFSFILIRAKGWGENIWRGSASWGTQSNESMSESESKSRPGSYDAKR
jgi:hypothetical protein